MIAVGFKAVRKLRESSRANSCSWFSAVGDSRSLSEVRGNGSLRVLARRSVLRASCSAYDLHKKHWNAFAGDFFDYLRVDCSFWIQPRRCCWNHRNSRRHLHPIGPLAKSKVGAGHRTVRGRLSQSPLHHDVGGTLVSRPTRRLRSIAPTCRRVSTSGKKTAPSHLWRISRLGCGVRMKNISRLFSRAIQR